MLPLPFQHCSDNTHPCQSDMNIEGAWKRGYTGKNIVVTILDDGIERTHPDLMQNYVSVCCGWNTLPPWKQVKSW